MHSSRDEIFAYNNLLLCHCKLYRNNEREPLDEPNSSKWTMELKATKLSKSVKFKCGFCKEMAHKTEIQLMADLPALCLAPCTPPFYHTECNYFGPHTIKIGRNKTAKHYGVLFTCLNTRAVHLEMAVDCSTMEFLQVLRRLCHMRSTVADDDG